MMQALKQNIKPNRIYALLVFFYVISAIAFESTPETARISTLAIYMVFLSGVVYALFQRKVMLNTYIVSLLMLILDAYIMTFPSTASSSMGFRIVYLMLTCAILCIIVFWLAADKLDIIQGIVLGNIIGSLILVFRVVSAYGGISQVFAIASSTGEYRIGKLITNENALGLFLASAILSCMLLIISKKRSLIFNMSMFSCICVFAIMLLLTGSRKSLLFGVLGAISFFLLYYRNASFARKFMVYILIVSAIFGLIHIMRTVPMFSTIYERFELLIEGFLGKTTYATDVTREYMTSIGIAEFWNNPLFGRGTGRSYVLFQTYSHNNFVELLMSYGLIGFLIYYIPYIALLVRLWKLVCQRDVYAIYFTIYIGLQLVLGVGWVNYYERHSQLLTAAAWGYLTYHYRHIGAHIMN